MWWVGGGGGEVDDIGGCGGGRWCLAQHVWEVVCMLFRITMIMERLMSGALNYLVIVV